MTSGDAPDPGAVEAAMIRAAASNAEALERLERALRRFARSLGPALEPSLGEGVTARLARIEHGPRDAAIPPESNGGLVAVAGGGETAPLLSMTAPALHSLAALSLRWPSAPREGHAPTEVERRIHLRLLDRIAGTLREAVPFGGGPTRPLDAPAAERLGPADGRCTAATVTLETGDASHDLHIALPHALLAAARPSAADPTPASRAALAARLRAARVPLAAVMVGRRVRLADALAWKAGQMVDLGLGPTAPVELRCGDAALFRCSAGRRKGGTIALRIDEDTEGWRNGP